MKQYCNHIMMLAGMGFLALFSSCMREQPDTAQAAQGLVSSFKAEIDADYIWEDLRSTVDVNTGASAFQNGDEVLLTRGATTGLYRYDGSSFVYVEGTEYTYFADAVAFFPASMVSSKGEGKSFNVDLAAFARQNYSETGILSDLPMFGRFMDLSTCRFYNLCTILKISAADGAATEGKTIASVTFTSHEAPLTGAALCENNKLVMAPDGGKTITLSASPASLGSATTWYLKLPAQTYPGGFELSISFTDGFVYTYSTNKSITLRPGYVSPMDAFTCNYFSGGSGSRANPYRIATRADLLDMSDRISERNAYTTANTGLPKGEMSDRFRDKHYILTADISASYVGVIGTESNQYFTGSFDGQGHSIRNLTVSRGNYDRCALFGTLDGATVKNVNFVNASSGNDSRTASYTAVLAGSAINGSLVENCSVSGSVGGYKYTGGIVGYLQDAVVSHCQVTSGTISATHQFLGGIAGSMSGSAEIVDCAILETGVSSTFNGGTDGAYAGGIVGLSEGGTVEAPGRIVRCCSSVTNTTTKISSAHRRSGGIVGTLKAPALVNECWSNMTVSAGRGHAGGIVGCIDVNSENQLVINCTYYGGTVEETADSGTNGGVAGIVGSYAYEYALGGIQAACVVNCFSNPAAVTSPAIGAGGVVGYLTRQTVDNCFSPIPQSALTSSSDGGKFKGGVAGIMRRGGRTLNCYAVYQDNVSHDKQGADAANDIWKVTTLSDAEAKAASASVVVPSTGETATSLLNALNRGADLYNNGGNATDLASAPYHGSPKYGVLAKSWVLGQDGYPVLAGSPLL